jgi:hypothetical protein
MTAPDPAPPDLPPARPDASADDGYEATQRLLVAELDAERFGDVDYLRWFYGANPRGTAIQQDEDDPATGARIGHYAVIPTRFRTPSGPAPWIFSSNVATDSATRRGGLFRRMAERMYERAASTGAPAMVGVGNDASTVVVVGRFGWRKLAPMRAKLALCWIPAKIESIEVDEGFLTSDRFRELTTDLDCTPLRQYAQSWDTDFLRWRLARPHTHYVLHVARDALAVSIGTTGPLGIRFAVLLKVWPRPGARLPVETLRLAGAAARSHRTPLCVYAGWNRHTRVRGIPIPHRLQPSPLNVVLKVLDPELIDGAAFTLDTWELLDMDAY